MNQKEIFINREADNWFQRNIDALDKRDYTQDTVCREVGKFDTERKCKILEVGCSAGHRLTFLSTLGYSVKGIEPSILAVNKARSRGCDVIQGTADNLNLADQTVDILIFGFCLYLVDPADYFKIAAESYRVLSDNGVIIIHDFAPKTHYKNEYVHLDGVKSYKFDFSQIFLSHPHLVLKSKTTETHSRQKEDMNNQDEWVQISVISKHISLF